MDNNGYIKIETYTANQGIPITNVIGNIYSTIENEKLKLGQLITDNDGISNTIKLPSINSSASQTPSDENPYTVYDLEIIKPGYKNKYFKNIPVFPNVVSIQQIPMEIDYSKSNWEEVWWQKKLAYQKQ